jgi:hypothetical protein
MFAGDPAAAKLLPITSRHGHKKTGDTALSDHVTLCLPNMTDADQLSLPHRTHSL